MTAQITNYEVMFALRTGVTILTARIDILDNKSEKDISFCQSPEDSNDLLISTKTDSIILKNLKADYREEALERGFLMLYEMEDNEIIRCMSCPLKKKA